MSTKIGIPDIVRGGDHGVVSRRVRAVIVTVCVAAAAWLVMEPLAGINLRAPAFGEEAAGQEIGPLAVIFASLAASLAAWAALAVLERFSKRPGRWWMILTGIVLLVSLTGPTSGTGIDTTVRVMLVLLHLVVAATLVSLLYPTIPANRPHEGQR